MAPHTVHDQQDRHVTARGARPPRRLWPRWICRAALLAAWAGAAIATTTAAPRVSLTGAGATFPAPVYQAWSLEYRGVANVELRYAAVGSGLGVERIRRGQVDFGASDAPLTREELDAQDLVQFPAVIGGVLPVTHITGVRPGELKLTGAVLARIYLGRIRHWNDPAITALNPGLHLPSSNITVVHRSDSSGSSLLWTTYLASADADWRVRVGASLLPSWPTGVGASGNEGVASYVERTRYAIGYVEFFFARAHNLSDIALRNRNGQMVRARPENFVAAVATDWRTLLANRQLPVDAPGPSSWPITGASFILVPKHPADVARARAVLQFFDWGLRGGAHTVEELEYAALPTGLIDQIPQLWQSVRDAAGKPIWP